MLGFFPDNTVPIIVMIDESASLKLFTASNMIAIEFERSPTIALKNTKNTFTTIPDTLIFIIFLSLSILITLSLLKDYNYIY